MKNRTGCAKPGFTLIELLVVVGIIAILAAIALPNFLEAQTRAKIARAKSDLRTVATGVMSFVIDHNKPFTDANDSNSPPELVGLTFETENHMASDLKFLDPSESQYYTFRAFTPLTTPISYLSFLPRDPFSAVLPMSYDTREVNGSIAYCACSSAGPDHIAGQWLRTFTDTHMAITYDPTNGTTSAGDLWRAMCVGDPDLFHKEYGAEIP